MPCALCYKFIIVADNLAGLFILPSATTDNQSCTFVANREIGYEALRQKAILYICMTGSLFMNTITLVKTCIDTVFMYLKTYNFEIVQHLTRKH